MKYSTALAAFAAAGLASAQSLEDVPQCARQCLGPAIKETGCSETDVGCLCKAENREKIVSSGTGCVLQSCGQETAINEVLPAITRICENSLGGGEADNTFMPGTTMPTTGVATATTSGSVPTGSVSIPTVTGTGGLTTTSTPIGIPTSRPGTNGTTTTGAPIPAGAPKLTGLSGVAMLALAFFAAY
nr:secretory protein [Falciphora oryzae]